MEDIVIGLDPKATTPGLLEQYKLNLSRYKPGSASWGTEFIIFPGLLSRPSEYFHPRSTRSELITRCPQTPLSLEGDMCQ